MNLVISQAVFVPFGKHLLCAQKLEVITVFFDKFSALCQKMGVSKSKAAESVGLNRTSVMKWKNGAVPSGATITKLAEYFGVSADYLLDNSDISPETQKAPTLNKKDELLDDDDFIVLQRNLQNIPEADRKRIIRNFRDTVDIYLNRLGVENEKEGK